MRTRPTLTWEATGSPLPRTDCLDDVVDIVGRGHVAVLSGAGLSTESGIPDYRGPAGRLLRHTPMSYEEFLSSEHNRRRYWARSHLGWRTITRARPNDGHRAVTELTDRGLVSAVITQNVDGLHQAAGSPDVVELHGSLGRVSCLHCGRACSRDELDARLRAENPDFGGTVSRVNPDGDAELPDEVVRGFRLVECAGCASGPLKPDVVFFGENVPRERVQRCFRLVDDANALLVLGSSLAVMSGLRFVRHAARAGKPILIVNQGPTRGDQHATVRVDRPLGSALTELLERTPARHAR